MKTLLHVFLVMMGILFVIIFTPIALFLLWIGQYLFLGILCLFLVALCIVELWKFFTGDTTSIFNMFSDNDKF